MRGNSHVPLVGEEAMVTPPPYPTLALRSGFRQLLKAGVRRRRRSLIRRKQSTPKQEAPLKNSG